MDAIASVLTFPQLPKVLVDHLEALRALDKLRWGVYMRVKLEHIINSQP